MRCVMRWRVRMADRRDIGVLQRIGAVREAQRSAARGALLSAVQRQSAAEAAQARAEARMQDAVAAWGAQLAEGGFAPELAQALAGTVNAAADAASRSQAHVANMADARAACEAALRTSEARYRQADAVRAARLRADTRTREKRALDAAADRTTMQWGRR